jgi:hypothetical protein
MGQLGFAHENDARAIHAPVAGGKNLIRFRRPITERPAPKSSLSQRPIVDLFSVFSRVRIYVAPLVTAQGRFKVD